MEAVVCIQHYFLAWTRLIPSLMRFHSADRSNFPAVFSCWAGWKHQVKAYINDQGSKVEEQDLSKSWKVRKEKVKTGDEKLTLWRGTCICTQVLEVLSVQF